ncbi:hypothetical protein [Neorhizobium sp. DT-125]|uniref:hypothetical protein n=1 Tax=Neorhizobium sp. DT-125 TaxID=3396163 RepID=UPI003F1B59CC
MSRNDAIISAGAVALSTAATVAALIAHLRRMSILTEAMEHEIYEQALMMVEESQGDDDSGVFTAARELIEEHLRPEQP